MKTGVWGEEDTAFLDEKRSIANSAVAFKQSFLQIGIVQR